MLDPKLLRNDLDAVAGNLARRGFVLDCQRFRALESERKRLQHEVEMLRQQRNTRSKAIGAARAAGEDIGALRKEVGALGDALAKAESLPAICYRRARRADAGVAESAQCGRPGRH